LLKSAPAMTRARGPRIREGDRRISTTHRLALRLARERQTVEANARSAVSAVRSIGRLERVARLAAAVVAPVA
jgi:hypothetical protein